MHAHSKNLVSVFICILCKLKVNCRSHAQFSARCIHWFWCCFTKIVRSSTHAHYIYILYTLFYQLFSFIYYSKSFHAKLKKLELVDKERGWSDLTIFPDKQFNLINSEKTCSNAMRRTIDFIVSLCLKMNKELIALLFLFHERKWSKVVFSYVEKFECAQSTLKNFYFGRS